MNVDYKAIADKAVEIIGSVDPAQYQDAYDAMILETKSIPVTREVRITEQLILAGLKKDKGGDFISRLEGQMSPTETRVFRDIGIDVSHESTRDTLQDLFNATAITKDQHDWVKSHYNETVPAWPGLRPGYVQDALRKRQGGEI